MRIAIRTLPLALLLCFAIASVVAAQDGGINADLLKRYEKPSSIRISSYSTGL